MDFGNKGLELSGATGIVPDLNILFSSSLLEASMCFQFHRTTSPFYGLLARPTAFR